MSGVSFCTETRLIYINVIAWLEDAVIGKSFQSFICKLKIGTITLPEVKRVIDSEWRSGMGYWRSLLTGVDIMLHSAEIQPLVTSIMLIRSVLEPYY